MSTLTIGSIDLKMRVMNCPVCGMSYTVPEAWIARKQRESGDWYCPSGHSLHFTETELDRVKKELVKEHERIAWYRQHTRGLDTLIESERRSKAAVKGQLTKVRNRVANGVCPCCNRTFANLARHMANQHPDFTQEAS